MILAMTVIITSFLMKKIELIFVCHVSSFVFFFSGFLCVSFSELILVFQGFLCIFSSMLFRTLYIVQVLFNLYYT